MDHLLRALAPITDSGWQLLDDEAKQRLTPALAARRLVDFAGPHGWEHSAANLGRTVAPASPQEGVAGLRRRVLSLAELRANFTVSAQELGDQERGALDVDLSSLDDAAHRIAVAENIAVFRGWPEAEISGVIGASPHESQPLGEHPESYPRAVAGAVELLLRNGIGGPYGMALGREQYRHVVETAEHGGQLLLDHLRKILDGSDRLGAGGRRCGRSQPTSRDFIFDCGQDLSIGYQRHEDQAVHLYIEESFTFLAATPEAAVALIA